MEAPISKFLLLSGLLEIIYKPGQPRACQEAFGDLFALINDPCRAFEDKDGAFNNVLTQFIQRCLCRNRHYKNADHARSQWEKELYDREKRSQLRLGLQEILSRPLEETIYSTPPSSKFKLRVSGTPASPEEDVARKVTEKAYEPLTDLDQKPGRLYLISLPGQEDMFKVGFTKDIKNRFSTHRRCYGDITIVKNAFLPFARRIEQLILAELFQQHCVLTEKCESCDKSHKEWIQIGKADMVTVFDKWVEFARGENELDLRVTEAYDKDGNFSSKHVALPPPAGNYKFLVSTSSKKSRRRSTGASSQNSPSKPSSARSDISFIDEGISYLSLGDSQPGNDDSDEDDHSEHISSFAANLLAAHTK
ncbi:hypothetical protein N7508_009301 [Penicillium antarcticum]|uniref:uncharacterized protein n=1 Tax=Penicillium antarcticum TaxID=416450 RepID=UPI002391F767|nr:uncharacterized protein N7508_009301 [Penicillium antarcticum]KAJ5294480.1 hypothetical protein N7508_009301 [Penicillium antarcticum]